MPLYEYQGQQYEMAEEDPLKAKSRILGYIEKQKAPEPSGAKQVGEDAPDFTRGLGNFIPQLESTYGGAKVLAGKALGDKEMMQSGIGHMKAGEAKTETKESDEFTNAWSKGIGTVLTDWLPYQAGAGVGSLLETLGMMGIGAGVGAVTGAGVGAVPAAAASLVGKQLVKKGIKEAAETILRKEGKEAAEAFIENEAKKTLAEQITAGAATQGAKAYGSSAGIMAQAGLHGAGETTGRAVQEGEKRAQEAGKEYNPEELDLKRLLPAAIAHSVADYFGEKVKIGALQGIGDKATKSLILDITKAVGATGTKELLPETIQTIAERYGANLSLTDADALKDYINTAAASYAMSVIPGGIGGARTHFATRPVASTTEETGSTEETKPLEEKTVEETAKKEIPNFERKFDAQGNFIQSTPPSPLANQKELPDFVLPQEKIDTLEVDNERIKNKLAGGEYKNPNAIKNAEAKLAKQQTEIETLSKGEPNGRPIDNTPVRNSAEVSGEPNIVQPPEGSTSVNPAGMGGTNDVVTRPQAGESAQPSALEPYKVGAIKPVDFTQVKDAIPPNVPVPEKTAPLNVATKTQEQELEDQAEEHFAQEKPEEITTRLKAAPRTQSAENQQRQVRARQRDAIIDEIKADTTRTPAQKDTEIHMQSYLVAAGNNIKRALDFLSADMFSETSYNDNVHAPFTGGKAAKAFYGTLSPNDKKYVDNKIKFLKDQDQRLNRFRGDAKDKAKAEEISYERSIELANDPDAKLSPAELKILNRHNKKTIAKNKSETAKLGVIEEGTGNTTPKLMSHMLRGDLRGALREIANDTTGAFTNLDKLIAKRLLLNDSLPALHVVSKLDGYGNYNNGTDVVTIREDSLNSHTLLHEALHGFTLSYIRANENSVVVKELNKLYEYLKAKHPELMDEYGMKTNDIAEFISEVFSNRLFQEKLNKIPYKSSSAIADFAKKVLQMLGISPNGNYTALAQALISTERILTEGRKFQTTTEFETPEISNLEPKKAEAEPKNPDAAYNIPEKQQPRNLKNIKRMFTTVPGIRNLVTNLQNERYEAKVLEEVNDMAGKIIRSGNKKNNFYEWLTLSAGRAKDFYNSMVEEHYIEINNAVNKIAKEKNLDTEVLLNYLHQYLEAKHEPERRRVKYIFTVPMTKNANERRIEILKILNTEKLNKEQAENLRAELEAIVNNKKNLDPLGESPPGVFNKKPINDDQKAGILDENNSYYNVTGLSPEEAQGKIERFTKLLGKENLESISKPIQALVENTKIMNAKSHYWSDPVENRANFYGWKDYVPLKGISKETETDEFLDYGDDNKERLGTDLVRTAVGYGGREGPGTNPLLETLSDATKAAMRAGRGEELTLAIKNAILDKIIPGTVNKATKGVPVSFDERDSSDILQVLTKGNKFILNHNKDGSVDILEITDPKILEAIRRTYKTTNTLTDIANRITSGLGKMHTRYNFNFAPLNFVRDALTNAFAMGASIGPFKSAEFLAKLSTDIVVRGGMGKAFNAARLYAMPNGMEKLKALADKNSVYKNMYDYIKQGGMVEYLQGMSIKSNFEQLNKKVGRSGIITKIEDANKMLDIWNNMFELSSRSSAYAMMRDHYMQTEKLDKESSETKAAAFVKNLANFEQVGKYGKELGAIYMFFRPSATGAVRAIEAAAPAFQSKESAKARLPKNIRTDEKALAKWEKQFEFQQKSSRYMVAALMGLGYVMFNMAKMMAPDDDLGRNKVLTDNMDQWNRFARFHFPGTDKVFQIPWGFGLGSFAASGAQLAGAMSGNGTMGDAMRNIFTQISLDSFVPIPVSRMKFSDDPALFVVDSVLPSFMRPIVEFTVNKNGLGQAIYNDSQRRMGDAYLGGDNIPQIYKDIAEYLNESTLGSISWSPNSLYFLTNSYMDGPARTFLELPTGLYNIASGQKDLSSKTDIPFIGSFVGTTSNVDAREFDDYSKQIKEKAKIIGGFKSRNPDRLDDYLDKYPFDEMLVDTYDKGVAKLNKLRKEANEIRASGDSPKEIAEQLKENKEEQNLLKNDLVEQFKDYKN